MGVSPRSDNVTGVSRPLTSTRLEGTTMNPLRAGVIAFAGLVGAGALAWPTLAAPQADGYLKRDEQGTDLVLVADDDDDTNDRATGDTATRSRNTGISRSTRDNTRSNFTRVSRDRDRSRSDKTRDKTYDGKGGEKRDWSGNTTNDRSRNDSRGR